MILGPKGEASMPPIQCRVRYLWAAGRACLFLEVPKRTYLEMHRSVPHSISVGALESRSFQQTQRRYEVCRR